jgi:AcrR family transcriptional regulator
MPTVASVDSLASNTAMSTAEPTPRTPTNRKPRASSQARIAQILAAARELLVDSGVGGLSIYSVAERAAIPPSSVYHFFASVPALLEALTADIHAAFRASLQEPVEHDALNSWHDLSRLIEQRMLAIYQSDAAARQLILAQHGLAEVTQADRQHDIKLAGLMQVLFERHFQLPVLPHEVDVFALAMELGDRVYARSVHLHGGITPRMAEEGMRVFDAYLGLYLPPFLPKRAAPH